MQLNMETRAEEAFIEYELMVTPPASAIAGRPIYVAKITNHTPVNLLTLAEKLAQSTPYRVEDVVHILSSLADLMQTELASGHSINFGSLFHLTPTIHGTFDAPDEAFNPEKQRIVVKACTGKLLRDAARELKAKRRPTPPPVVPKVKKRAASTPPPAPRIEVRMESASPPARFTEAPPRYAPSPG